MDIWDVFLLDSDFAIERPKRYYRQGLSLLQHEHESSSVNGSHGKAKSVGGANQSENGEVGRKASIRHTFHNILHPHHKAAASVFPYAEGDQASISTGSSSSDSRPATPLLDPSTNMNPLAPMDAGNKEDHEAWHPKKDRSGEVSRHTFYVINSQLKLKVSCKNKVSVTLSARS